MGAAILKESSPVRHIESDELFPSSSNTIYIMMSPTRTTPREPMSPRERVSKTIRNETGMKCK